MSRIDEALRRARAETGTDRAYATLPLNDDPADVDLWALPDEWTLLAKDGLPPAGESVIGPGIARVAPLAAVAPVPPLPRPAPSEAVGAPRTSAPRPAAQPVARLVDAPAAVARAPVAAPLDPAAPAMSESVEGRALVTRTHRSDAVEQYRKLAATLHHVQANRGVRVLLCTSASVAEGKTVTSANLALTLSQAYQRRVLLIDADLRRPRLHSLFDVANREGLYEALRTDVDRKVNVRQITPYLSLVTAGRPGSDPVHVLTSERLARVLEDAGSSFDWVIIDTPPVLILPDAGLLMGLVDGAVFVIGAGTTTHRMAKRATEALGRDRIIGVVMNRAADAVVQESHGGYGGYYGYGESAAAAK